MTDGPWSKTDIQKAADEYFEGDGYLSPEARAGFLDGIAWAAEMIEKSSTVYGSVNGLGTLTMAEAPQHKTDTHVGKLVNAKPIEKGKADE